MPKSLREYSADDWRHLRPVTQAVKSLRYRAIDRGYRRRRARVGDTAVAARSIRERRVLVTIAFGDPALIRWQTQLVRHYVPGVRHIVVDNSLADEAAEEIRRIAGAGSYLRAPENPWSGGAASRSHAIVLNWAWDNLIRPGEPEAFGCLDHDIFPTAIDDPFAPLATQDVYGVVRTVGRRWFLWAGFCMFRFAAVKNAPLGFGQDWFAGLDTGGGNWNGLYQRIDVAKLKQPATSFVPFKPGIAVADGPLQWCGPWLHEIGLMGLRSSLPRSAASSRRCSRPISRRRGRRSRPMRRDRAGDAERQRLARSENPRDRRNALYVARVSRHDRVLFDLAR
jgi:hypothetical protein